MPFGAKEAKLASFALSASLCLLCLPSLLLSQPSERVAELSLAQASGSVSSNADSARRRAIEPIETPAPSSTGAAATGLRVEDGDSNPELVIGGGDLLEVKVYGVSELSDSVRVSSKGYVSLALIGDLKVGGLTTHQAETLIQGRLLDGGYLKDPHVSVFIKEYTTQGISVMGEVSHPGVYPLLGSHRLFDAISAAGGTTSRAGRAISITHRDRPQDPQMIIMNGDLAKSGDNNLEVRPGDTVIVSKAGVVYVVGDVARPGGFVMENNESLTVMQSIALAQGTNSSAALNSAKLIRKTPNALQEIPVPLKRVLEGKAPDITMQGEDVLFVPASAGKNVVRRSAEAVLQIATGVAVYRR